MQQKQPSRKPKARLFLAVVMITLTIFLVNLASAYTTSSFQLDTAKQLEMKSETNYGTITLKDRYYADLLGWFDKDLATLTLKENTDSCGNSCYAIKDIELFEEGSLVDDVRFYRVYEDGKQELSSIRSYEVLIKTDEKTTIEEVYEYQCKETGFINANGTAEMSCSNVKVGEKEVIEDVWGKYNLGDKMPRGTYTVKLVGEKRAEWSYDWQVLSNGAWTEEWSVWGLTNFTEMILQTSGGSGVAANNYIGNKVAMKYTFNSAKVYMNVSDNLITDANACVILNGAYSLIGSVSIVGGYCIFNGINLTSGSNYYFGLDGAASVHAYGGSYKGVPSIGTSLNWTEGFYDNSGSPAALNELFFRGLIITDIGSRITLNSPINYYNSSSSTITFNTTANVVGATLRNASIWTNRTGVWARNQTTALTGTTNSTTWTVNFPADGNYKWGIQACDSDNDCGWSENRTVSIDTTAPTINLLYPTGIIPYGYVNQTLQLNFSATDENLDKCGFGYYKSFGSSSGSGLGGNRSNDYITTYYNNTNYSMIARLYMDRIGTPLYKYTVNIPTTCNNGGKVTLWDDDVNVSCINTGGANVTLAPSVGGYGVLGQFFEITDCSSGVFITPNIILDGTKSIWVYASDDAGNLNISSFSWDYNIFQATPSYSTTTYTTSIENINVSVSFSSAYTSIEAKLNYNGTNYTSTKTSLTSTSAFFNNAITIPGISTASNFNFYWLYTLANATGSLTITGTNYTQTASPLPSVNITSSSCPAGLSSAFYFNFANEQNLTMLNASANYNIQYGISNTTGVSNYGSFTNINGFNICINSSNPTYSLGYGEVEYSLDSYTTRKFYLFQTTRMTNQTVNNTLYLLPTASATSFLFESKGLSQSVYSNKYLTLLRWYPGVNQYNVVEMGKTDNKGQTVMRVKGEDTDYRVGIYETNGSLIYLANPIRFACVSSPCTYYLNIPDITTTLSDVEGIQVNLSYNNNTKIFTLVYNDPSQNTDSMRLHVSKSTGTVETVICNTIGIGFTGVLTCDSTGHEGIITALAFRTASPENPIASLIITLRTVIDKNFGLFISFITVLILGFIGIVSPIMAIIFTGVGLIMAVVMGSLSFGMLAVIATIGGIIIHMINRS